jgi:pyruvate dehydrogenase E2 component (dihydrolipoamide acetyltransferase)
MASRFSPVEQASTFRKIAAATWRRPNDPTIYGSMDVDMTAALAFRDRYREEQGVRITVTHLVARALALAISRFPDVNAKVRFWGKLEQRKTIDLVIQVAAEGGRDLSTARIAEADRKSLADIAAELDRQAAKIRGGDDENYAQSRGMLRKLPWWLTRAVLDASDYLVNELHLDLSSQGMPLDPFGSAMVTNVGMFGIDTAFAPFLPIARCPMLVLVPQVRDRPWVVDGRVESRPVLRLCATFDHRIIDGFQAGKLSSAVTDLLENPESLCA